MLDRSLLVLRRMKMIEMWRVGEGETKTGCTLANLSLHCHKSRATVWRWLVKMEALKLVERQSMEVGNHTKDLWYIAIEGFRLLDAARELELI